MATKLGAETFLYMDPEPHIDSFAQCLTCRDWIENDNLCRIHGPSIEVLGTMSCGLYVYGEGPPDDTEVYGVVLPTESGLVDRKVRCENCKHSNGDTCGFFAFLNDKLPDTFEIDIAIDPKGCCNAQQSRET